MRPLVDRIPTAPSFVAHAAAQTGAATTRVLVLACMLVLSVVLLAIAHNQRDSTWLMQHLPAISGSDGILWQVQTTFLSVGFAGLAIAAQLFADAPLAIGASRGRVLGYIHANWFAGLGLVANAVMAIETMWLPSGLGALIALLWFLPTVVMLVVSTGRLMQLFGHPSRLDEVVRMSLVETLSNRLGEVSRRYVDARKQLDGLVTSGLSVESLKASGVPLRVPVPQVGLVIRAIKPKPLRQALHSLGPRATGDTGAAASSGNAELYAPPKITLDVEPGDRTRLGDTAFRVITSTALDQAAQGQLVRLLQDSIEFEPSGSVTPYEETDREIAILKDAVGMNLRSGAFATAERALELLGHVVRELWMAQSQSLDSSPRASFTRSDWLFRTIGETEQDALLSPRAAGLFVSAAMTRALEAPRTGSMQYVDESLRSFTRLWFDILRNGSSEFDSLASRITTCVQNLAAYSYSTTYEHEDLQTRATWATVELVKLALDAKKPEAAMTAAEELSGLFDFDRHGSKRVHVRAGQLVLSAWLDYLADTKDARDPGDPVLRALVTPSGTSSEILAARSVADRGATPFSRWDRWEMRTTASRRAQALQLSHFIDRAQLAALVSSYGALPPANDQQTAYEYKRLLSLLTEGDQELSPGEEGLRQRFTHEITKWDAAEVDRLAREPLSDNRVEVLRTALRETLNDPRRLAALVPHVDDAPPEADTSRPILGMNIRVPRHYLVDKVFNQTYADPKELGQVIAQGFAEGEEQRIVTKLRSLQGDVLEPTASAIEQSIEGLGREAEHYVLVTPYGRLGDIHEWYSIEFRAALERVTHVETGVLDGEAILFDRRSGVKSCRRPEVKDGLAPVAGTTIALGVFEDVEGGDEPQVRIETGEYFVVWAAERPSIHRFAPMTEMPPTD